MIDNLICAPLNWCIELVMKEIVRSKTIVVSGDDFDDKNESDLVFKNIRRGIVRLFGVGFYFFVFDLISVFYILFRRPKLVYLWSGCSLFSLILCKFSKITTILFCGSPSVYFFEPYKSRWGYKNKFIYCYRRFEYKLCDRIYTESNWSKSTYNEFIDKVEVRQTVIKAIKDIRETSVIKSDYLFDMIVPSTEDWKGFDIAIQLAEYTKDKINWHFFGEYDSRLDSMCFSGIYHGYASRSYFLDVLAVCDGIFILTKGDSGPRALMEAITLNKFVFASQYCIAPDLKNEYDKLYVFDRTSEISKLKADLIRVIHG